MIDRIQSGALAAAAKGSPARAGVDKRWDDDLDWTFGGNDLFWSGFEADRIFGDAGWLRFGRDDSPADALSLARISEGEAIAAASTARDDILTGATALNRAEISLPANPDAFSPELAWSDAGSGLGADWPAGGPHALEPGLAYLLIHNIGVGGPVLLPTGVEIGS